jgi:hypothetical protein
MILNNHKLFAKTTRRENSFIILVMERVQNIVSHLTANGTAATKASEAPLVRYANKKRRREGGSETCSCENI